MALKRHTYASDILHLDRNSTQLTVGPETKNLDSLGLFRQVKTLEIRNSNQKTLDTALSCISPDRLILYISRAKDFGAIKSIKSLQALSLEAVYDFTKIDDILGPSIEALEIQGCHKFNDLEGLSRIHGLKDLTLEGGISKNYVIDTLSPLGNLINLEYLHLGAIRVRQRHSVRDLKSLVKLKRLTLANRFDVEDLAFLSVHLPDTESNAFNAWQDASDFFPGHVMITGYRKPLLKLGKDDAKIARYEKKFEALRQRYIGDGGN